MPDEITYPFRVAAQVPAMPDDVALAAAATYGRHGYSDTGAAFAAAVGWQRGWCAGRETALDAADQALRFLSATLRETSEAPALVAEFLNHFKLAADASPADVLAAMARLVLVGTGELDEPCGSPECPCARREVREVCTDA